VRLVAILAHGPRQIKVVGFESTCLRAKVHIFDALEKYTARAANAASLPKRLLEVRGVLSSFAARPPPLTSALRLSALQKPNELLEVRGVLSSFAARPPPLTSALRFVAVQQGGGGVLSNTLEHAPTLFR
jgi:hypothetical protein